MKFIVPDNCDNSPKAQLLITFNEAFMKNDISAILDMVEDGIQWTLVGDKEIKGKEAFEKELKSMVDFSMNSMEIFNVITHGKAAAVNGLIIGADDKVYEFCDIYTFKSAGANKIKEIRSFIILKK